MFYRWADLFLNLDSNSVLHNRLSNMTEIHLKRTKILNTCTFKHKIVIISFVGHIR